MDLLNELIIVSEKAARIARLIRQDEHLFKLLVQQKSTNEANPRFIEDFKTLADVLIQEMVKHDIGKKFPKLLNSIRGEENNIFSNKLGETICVQVETCESQTADLLQTVLNGDRHAAELLAAEVHRCIQVQEVNTALHREEFFLDLNECCVWIDPIDCTAEYVNGNEDRYEEGICVSGLHCVTVLIGVYNKNTSLPIIGIVNQPFVKKQENIWTGKCFWGVAVDEITFSSFELEPDRQRTNLICLSKIENDDMKLKLRETGFKLIAAPGAGYKILTVITCKADAYILSKNSTYKWDTCAPQAILRSLGGNIFVFDDLIQCNRFEDVKYPSNDHTNNDGGIVAFRQLSYLNEIVDILK